MGLSETAGLPKYRQGITAPVIFSEFIKSRDVDETQHGFLFAEKQERQDE